MMTSIAARSRYASDPNRGRGRLIAEPASPTRTEFQRDRDRIVHSTAFRRLADKTQVFVAPDGDHFRTRLTHTIEVAQIARALARALGLDDDLAEAVALAHDLGHPPFGHTGEDVLNAVLQPWGGFDHNAQALRIVTRLERRYATFDGLNLSWETLEGLVKHNGPLIGDAVPPVVRDYDRGHPLDLASFASAEAQAAALADDIAYNAHDIDDGLRAGLFDLDTLKAVPFLASLLAEVETAHPGLEPRRAMHELVRRVITRFVEDAIAESTRRLAAIDSPAAARAAGRPVIAWSPELVAADRAIKAFLTPNMYRHPSVLAVRQKAAAVLHDLLATFLQEPTRLPHEWGERAARLEAEPGNGVRVARLVGDYVAGLTDRAALHEHRRHFDATPDMR